MATTEFAKPLKTTGLTLAPIEIERRSPVATIEPEFIRLPKPGELCQRTGLSRSALNELILPCSSNQYAPPVRSFVLRKKGARTGIRLIEWQSLRAYIRRHPQEFSEPKI